MAWMRTGATSQLNAEGAVSPAPADIQECSFGGFPSRRSPGNFRDDLGVYYIYLYIYMCVCVYCYLYIYIYQIISSYVCYMDGLPKWLAFFGSENWLWLPRLDWPGLSGFGVDVSDIIGATRHLDSKMLESWSSYPGQPSAASMKFYESILWSIDIYSTQYSSGFVWKCCVPLNPMVLLIIIPMKNGYFIGNIPNIFRQTHL